MHLLDPYYGVGNVVLGAAYAAAAALVLAGEGHARRANRSLALMLVSFAVVPLLSGIIMLNGERPNSWLVWNAAVYVNVFATVVWIPYLAFLGMAVPSPLVAPLRWRPVRYALYGGMAIFVAAVVARPSLFLVVGETIETTTWGPFAAITSFVFPWGLSAVALFGTLAALDAFRRAPAGSPARRKARAYAMAFVAHDLAVLTWMGSSFVAADEARLVLSEVVSNAFGFAFLALLVRALLREQLFDFDLRFKVGVKRTTVAGAFLAVFLVAAQLIEQFTSGAFGLVGGAIVAGLMLFALHPLQRAAERVADVAVPGVAPTPAYLAFKKLEVYRAQVEASLADDGRIDERERRFLDRLRANLSIAAEDAAAIEDEATRGRPA